MEKWLNIMKEANRIETRGEPIVMLGDFNAHIAYLVPNNDEDSLSFRGSLVKEFLNTDDYILVNGMKNIVKGGPQTRIDPSDNTKGSVLDLVIVSKSLAEHVEL